MAAMTTTELVALVTAVASGLYTVWQGQASERQARDLERLKSDLKQAEDRQAAALGDAGAEKQARREYEFEARKRLYRDVQPLMFQMRDPLQSAVDHAANFARAAREDKLCGSEQPWLEDVYYVDATLYRLAAPAAYYELMRERMSLVDLSLDARAAAAFRLLDQYTRAMRADYRLAPAFYGERGYQPDGTARPADGSGSRQGLLAGTRDVMVQAMLRDGSAGPDGAARRRVVRFGEFQNDRAAAPAVCAPFADILAGFRPAARPALCALLLVLAGLAELTRRALGHEQPQVVADAVALACDDEFWAAYDFGLPPASAMRLRRVAMSDLLDCARRAADLAA